MKQHLSSRNRHPVRVVGLSVLVIFLLASHAPALINPKVQPRNLYDQYNIVAGLEVVSVDSKKLAIHTKVIEVLKGEYSASEITPLVWTRHVWKKYDR